MKPQFAQLLEEALISDEAEAKLKQLVEIMKEEGSNQVEIYSFLSQRYVTAHETDNRIEDDLLTDVLSLVWGWCPPSARLFSQNLTDEEVWEHQQSKREGE